MSAKWRLYGCVLLFVAGHLLLRWVPMPALWGLDLLGYVPGQLISVFLLGTAVIALLSCWPAAIRRLTLDPWSPGGRGWCARLLVVGAAGIFFVTWRSQVHLLGDGYLMLRELAMLVDRTGNEPLALWLVAKLYAALPGFDAEAVYQLCSYSAGIVYVSLALVMAAVLSSERENRWLVLAVLMTAGYVQLFCGYIETYPPLFSGALLYLLSGVYTLHGRLPLWITSSVLALLMTYHFIAITLVPSLLLVAWLGWQRGYLSRWYQVFGGFAVGPLVVLVVLYGVGVDLFAYATGLRGGHLLPFFADPDYTQAYGVLNGLHLLDLINVQLLAAPAVVLVLLGVRGAVRKKGRDEQRFFALAGLSCLAFTALANPEIGAFRDWDVLAFPALPLSLWAACGLMRSNVKRGRWLICGAAALHTFSWVSVNADAAAGLARYEEMLAEGTLSRHGRAYGWETLAAFYRDADRHEDALRAFARACEADPQNTRFREALAREALALHRPQEASVALQAALTVDDGDPRTWDLLGSAHTASGRYDEAVVAHRRSLALQGRDGVVWYNLGNAYLLAGDAGAAIAAYEEAVIWNGKRPELSYNRGLAYESLADWSAAKASYEEALADKSDYTAAKTRLAAVEEQLD